MSVPATSDALIEPLLAKGNSSAEPKSVDSWVQELPPGVHPESCIRVYKINNVGEQVLYMVLTPDDVQDKKRISVGELKLVIQDKAGFYTPHASSNRGSKSGSLSNNAESFCSEVSSVSSQMKTPTIAISFSPPKAAAATSSSEKVPNSDPQSPASVPPIAPQLTKGQRGLSDIPELQPKLSTPPPPDTHVNNNLSPSSVTPKGGFSGMGKSVSHGKLTSPGSTRDNVPMGKRLSSPYMGYKPTMSVSEVRAVLRNDVDIIENVNDGTSSLPAKAISDPHMSKLVINVVESKASSKSDGLSGLKVQQAGSFDFDNDSSSAASGSNVNTITNQSATTTKRGLTDLFLGPSATASKTLAAATKSLPMSASQTLMSELRAASRRRWKLVLPADRIIMRMQPRASGAILSDAFEFSWPRHMGLVLGQRLFVDFAAISEVYIWRAPPKDTECSICYMGADDDEPELDDFGMPLPASELIQTTKCKHTFCGECLVNYAFNHFMMQHQRGPQGDGSIKCPICREPLDEQDLENIGIGLSPDMMGYLPSPKQITMRDRIQMERSDPYNIGVSTGGAPTVRAHDDCMMGICSLWAAAGLNPAILLWCDQVCCAPFYLVASSWRGCTSFVSISCTKFFTSNEIGMYVAIAGNSLCRLVGFVFGVFSLLFESQHPQDPYAADGGAQGGQ